MEIAIVLIVAALILTGFVGIVAPVLPGTGLIFAGILLYALYFGIDTVGTVTLIVLCVATLFSIAIDYLASAYGAKKYGASKWGSLGAVVGGLLGFLALNFPGLILGIFVGAVAGEALVAKKDLHVSLRAGMGSILGFLGGTVLKVILGLAMIITFLVKIWP